MVLIQKARHPGHGHLTLGAWARRGGDGASGVTGRGCPRLPVPFLGCREALQKNLGKLPRNSCGRFWTNLGKQGKHPAERWPVSCTETMADGNREGPGREEEGRREGHTRGAQEATGAPSAPPQRHQSPPAVRGTVRLGRERLHVYFLAESSGMSLTRVPQPCAHHTGS